MSSFPVEMNRTEVNDTKYLDRWIYAVTGIIMFLFLGCIYAWTVIQKPIAATYTAWTEGQFALTFTLDIFCLCLGTITSSYLQRKIKVKYIFWVSALFLLLGAWVCSICKSPLIMWLGFGVVTGYGTGLSYTTTIGAVCKWFPDKPGLVSGILLMGFGLSSFFIGKVYTAFTPSDGSEIWRSSLRVMGLLVSATIFMGGSIVKSPPKGFAPNKPDSSAANKPESFAPIKTGNHESSKGEQKNKSILPKECFEEIGPKTVVKRKSFWLYMVWVTLQSIVTLAMISQIASIAMDANSLLPMTTIATVSGIVSIASGISRILFGACYDSFGNRVTMVGGSLCFLISMLLLTAALKSGSTLLLVLGALLAGMSHGCVPPTNSAFVMQFYGRENYAENFAMVNLNILVGSVGSAAAGMVYDWIGSYLPVLLAAACISVLSGIVAARIRKGE